MRVRMKNRKNKNRKTKLLRRWDLALFGPRPFGRGIFLRIRILSNQWYIVQDKLTLKFTQRDNNQWALHRSRSLRMFARHSDKGENRTNSCSSKTRHGSDAICRYIKFASPDICYANFLLPEVLRSRRGRIKLVQMQRGLVRPRCVLHLKPRRFTSRYFLTNNQCSTGIKEVSMCHRLELEKREKELFKQELIARLEALFDSAETANKLEEHAPGCSQSSAEEGNESLDRRKNPQKTTQPNPKNLRRYNGLLSLAG